MTERQDERRTPEAGRAQTLLRAAAAETRAAPLADPDFRARLRDAFVSGRIAEEPGPRGVRSPAASPKRPWYARTGPRLVVAAAAAMIAVVIGIALNQGPTWVVTAAGGAGEIQIDGESFSIKRPDLFHHLIRPGAEVVVPSEGQLEIMVPGQIAIQLTPGTRLTIPPPPPRWFGRQGELYARAGEIRIATASAFRGARLDVHTPQARIEVTGTTLAVIMEPAGTCVCVLEGTVRMARREGGGIAMVGPGTLCYAHADNPSMSRGPIRPTEQVQLAAYRALRIPVLEGTWEP